MSSELQQLASRTNGSKSRGPKTPAGKARSARNAIRHGLTSKVPLAEGESDDEYRELLNAYIAQFDPTPGVETELVESMAFARWRLRRLLLIESHLFDMELCRHDEDIAEEFENLQPGGRLAFAFQTLADQGRSLQMLVRYEGALNRTHDRALKQLQKLRAFSPAPHPPSPLPVPTDHAPNQKEQNEPNPAQAPEPRKQDRSPAIATTFDASEECRDNRERAAKLPNTDANERYVPQVPGGLTCRLVRNTLLQPKPSSLRSNGLFAERSFHWADSPTRRAGAGNNLGQIPRFRSSFSGKIPELRLIRFFAG